MFGSCPFSFAFSLFSFQCAEKSSVEFYTAFLYGLWLFQLAVGYNKTGPEPIKLVNHIYCLRFTSQKWKAHNLSKRESGKEKKLR